MAESLNNKETALKSAMKNLEQRFGTGTIMRLGDKPHMEIPVIPTGALNLDAALGIGGIAKGRITEIYGAEASGKTTLALHIAAESQKRGGIVAFVDAEHALDPRYAKNLGVDTDNLLLSQPDGGEQALEIVETLVRSSAVDLIIIDSVAALVPREEIEGSMGDHHVGLQARLMSQALRKLTSITNKSGTAVLFINQIRMKIGVPSYVNPQTTTGGMALKFYSSMRLEVRRSGSIKDSKDRTEISGNKTKVKVAKNKFAPPFKTVEFPIIFGKGISHMDILIDIAVENDIVIKKGSWYSYGEKRLGQGSSKVFDFLVENPKILADVEKKVKIILGLEKEDIKKKNESKAKNKK